MKKRILSILTALCLCLSLLPTVALAEDGSSGGGSSSSGGDTHTHCVCGGACGGVGDHTCDESVTWQPWEETDSLPGESGYYYLTADVTLAAAWEPADGIALCLNDRSITSNKGGSRVIQLNKGVTFTLTDCKGNGKVTHAAGKTGRGVEMTGSTSYSTFNLYGGSITGNSATWGGGVYVGKYGHLNIYGGSISGNSASQYGGGVYIKAGYSGSYYDGATFNLYGGSIANNTATLGGGGVCAYNADGTMTGGSITGNRVLATDSGAGGGLYLDNQSFENGGFTMTGGSISNNAVIRGNSDKMDTLCGGGVYLVNNGKFTMTGGSITGNSVSYEGAADASSGGGGVSNKGYRLTLSGSAIVTGNTVSSGESGSTVTKTENVRLNNGKTISVSSDFSGRAGITTNVAIGDGVQVLSGLEDNDYSAVRGRFFADAGDAYYVNSSGQLVQNTCTHSYDDGVCTLCGYSHTHCVCGGSCANVGDHTACADATWIGISGLGQISGSGNYYLTGDVTLATDIVITDGKQVALCLNGHTIHCTMDNYTAFQMQDSGSLAITDCKGTGRIVYEGTTHNNYTYTYTTCITGTSYGDFTMYGGTITGFTGYQNDIDESAVSYGGAIRHYGSGKVYIYGGSITGNSATKGGGGVQCGTLHLYGGSITDNTVGTAESYGSYGGGVYCNTLNMSGGTISGNTIYGSCGGGVYCDLLTMTGGTISDNSARGSGDGGGVYISGGSSGLTVDSTISGGSITGNSADNGGGVYSAVTGSGTAKRFVISERASITDNTATDCGGGVYAYWNFGMSGGSVTDNSAAKGGGVYLTQCQYLAPEITGGTVTGNKATENGGGVYYGYTGKKLNLSGTVSITGNTRGSAANNLFLTESSAQISVGALNGTSRVGISSGETPAENSPVNLSESTGASSVGCFASDSESCSIRATEAGGLELAVIYPARITASGGGDIAVPNAKADGTADSTTSTAPTATVISNLDTKMPDASVTWSVTGVNGAEATALPTGVTLNASTGVLTVDSTALKGYAASADGSRTCTVTVSAVCGSATPAAVTYTITRAGSAAARVSVTGGADTLAVPTVDAPGGQTTKPFGGYTATVYDQYGDEMDQTVTWSMDETTGVTLSSTSLQPNSAVLTLTNAAQSGNVRITAAVEGTDVSASRNITISRTPTATFLYTVYQNEDVVFQRGFSDEDVILYVPASGSDNYTYTAVVYDQYGVPMEGDSAVIWEWVIDSDKQNITSGLTLNGTTHTLTVSSNAEFRTGTTEASCTLRAGVTDGEGNTDMALINIKIRKRDDAVVTLSGASNTTYGTPITVTAGVPEGTAAGTWSWDYSEDVFDADIHGSTITLTPKKADTAGSTVTATYAGTTVYGTASATVKVAKKTLTAADLEFTADSTFTRVYDGTAACAATVRIKDSARVNTGDTLPAVSGSCAYNSADVTGATQVIYTTAAASSDSYILPANLEVTHAAAITPAELTNVRVGQSGTLTYTGAAQTATVTATADSVNSQPVSFTYSTAENGTYTAAVPSFTNAGTHTVWYRVSAPNHRDATGSFAVTIGAKQLTESMVGVSDLTYNGVAQNVTVTVRDGDKTLTAGTDYTLGGETSGTAAKTCTVTVSGVPGGNYTGTVNKEWTLQPLNISEATVTLDQTSLTYNGGEQSVTVESVRVGDVTLVKDTDYTVSGTTGTAATTYTVTITGKGSCTGTATAHFTIAPAALTVTAADQHIYTGAALPTLEYTVSGLVGADTADAVVTVSLSYQKDGTVVASPSAAGSYAIVVTATGKTDNYDITAVNGTLTISNRPVASSPLHDITVANALNGSASANQEQAREGSIVTVTVAPDADHTLESLTVLDEDGNALELTALGGNKYSFIMPASDVTVRASFTDGTNTGFVDVPADKYFYDAVNWAVENGITGGTDATHFSPYAACTRGQLVTFLWRAAGQPKAKNAENPFSDVRTGSSFYQAILWAAENDIVGGYADGTFRPNAPVTRQQVAAILYRYAKFAGMDVSVGEDTNILSFNDVFEVSEYAIAALQWAVGEQVITGNNGSLLPHNTCTRAQIVTMLYRLLAE